MLDVNASRPCPSSAAGGSTADSCALPGSHTQGKIGLLQWRHKGHRGLRTAAYEAVGAGGRCRAEVVLACLAAATARLDRRAVFLLHLRALVTSRLPLPGCVWTHLKTSPNITVSGRARSLDPASPAETAVFHDLRPSFCCCCVGQKYQGTLHPTPRPALTTGSSAPCPHGIHCQGHAIVILYFTWF